MASKTLGLIPGCVLVDFWKYIYKHQGIFLLLLGLEISAGPRGTKYHGVNPRIYFVDCW